MSLLPSSILNSRSVLFLLQSRNIVPIYNKMCIPLTLYFLHQRQWQSHQGNYNCCVHNSRNIHFLHCLQQKQCDMNLIWTSASGSAAGGHQTGVGKVGIGADNVFKPKHSQYLTDHLLPKSSNLFSQVCQIKPNNPLSLMSSLGNFPVRLFSNKTNLSEEDKKENIMTIPNLLCVSRIVLAPVIGYFVISEDFYIAFGLLLFACITDYFDGYIARKFKNQSSVFGSMLDPLSDKILMTALMISLTYANLIPLPLCALIIGRDVGIVTAVVYLRFTSLPPPRTLSRYFDVNLPTVQMKPTLISKFNTFFQFSFVGLSLAAPVFNFVDSPLLQWCWYFIATSTILSGLSYVILNKNTFRILKRHGKSKEIKKK